MGGTVGGTVGGTAGGSAATHVASAPFMSSLLTELSSWGVRGAEREEQRFTHKPLENVSEEDTDTFY